MTIPYYAIAAFSEPVGRLRGFFREGDDSPGWLLSRPRVFRHAGFDVSTLSIAEVLDGERWEVRSGDRKLIRLYQDGTLVFRMRADEAFLGWGQEPAGFANLPVLNPVAIIESHASFVDLYKRVIGCLTPLPSSVTFQMRFHEAHVEGRRIAVSQYFPRGVRFVDSPTLYHVHDVNAAIEVTVPAGDIVSDVLAVTYQLLTRFYDMFDADHDLLPFVDARSAVKRVDLASLTRI